MMGTGIDLANEKDDILTPKTIDDKATDYRDSTSNFKSIDSNVVHIGNKHENGGNKSKRSTLKRQLDHNIVGTSQQQ